MGHPCKFQPVSRLDSVTARHSSSERQPNFAALNTGRHLYSAGRPSGWALVHIFTNMKLPARELIPCGSKFCLDKWQDIWDCCEGNELHSIYPTIGIVEHSKNMSRYDSNRLRFGHCRVTHSYLMCGDDPPTCLSCGHPLTVKHILVASSSGCSATTRGNPYKLCVNHCRINVRKHF